MTTWTQYPITEHFGESYGSSVEHGVDIGTPFHTPITNLYAGTVTDVSRHGWGYQIGILTSLAGIGPVIEYFQHIDIPAVVKGQFVKVGQLIGLSGGQTSGGNAPNDPQYSSGAHTEFGFDAPWIGGVTSNMPKPFDPTSYLTGKGAGPSSDTCAGTAPDWCQYTPDPTTCIALFCTGNQVQQTASAATVGVGDFLSKIMTPDFWTRVGLIVGGLLVIIIGLTLFVKDMQE